MGRYLRKFGEVFRKGDLVLLVMCMALNIFGLLMIASTTNQMGPARYVIVQSVAAVLGIFMYVLVSSIDTEFFAEHRYWLVVFNCFLLLLLIPFGTDMGSGNKSWLDFPILPVNIQPAEICKITFILILASVMASFQNQISSVRSVFTMVFHLGLLAGLWQLPNVEGSLTVQQAAEQVHGIGAAGQGTQDFAALRDQILYSSFTPQYNLDCF